MATTKSDETLNDAEKAVQARQDGTEPFDTQKYQIIRDKFSHPTKRLVLLLTGSFNPVTIAHLRMLELARDYYHLRSIQVLEGILSPVSNSYGKPGLVEAKHRIEMLEAAIPNDPWRRADSWEASQTSWTRTKLVLEHHHEEAKKRFGEDTEIKLLSGADVVRTMLNPDIWKPTDVEDIMTNFGVPCINRLITPEPGKSGATLTDVTEGLPDLWKKHIDVIQDWVVNDISATNIRKKLETGGSVKYVVPDGTIEVIRKYGLYNSNKTINLAEWPFDKKE